MRKQIGERFRLFRTMNSMTQTEAAFRIGVTKEHIGLVERGKSYPSMDMLVRAASAYGTELFNFFLLPEKNAARMGDASGDLVSNICGVWTMDLAEGRDVWSEDLRRILGLPHPHKAAADDFFRIVRDRERPRAKRFFNTVRARGRPRPLRCTIVRADGIARRLLIQADQLEDEAGVPDVARLIIQDISDMAVLRNHLIRDRQHLEAVIIKKTTALLASEQEARAELDRRIAAERETRRQSENLERILTAVPAILYSFAPSKGGTEWHSPHMQAILGISQRELQDDPMLWHDSIHPDDLPMVDEAIRLAQEGHPIDVEYRIRGRDGQWRWLHDRAIPYRDETGAFHLAGVAVNVTERKRNEEDLRLKSLILDQITDQVAITDLNGVITYVNQTQADALGMPREEIIGRSTDVFGDDPRMRYTQRHILEQCLRDGAWRGEVCNAAGGAEKTADLRAQVILDTDGRPAALFGIATDISEQRKAEAAVAANRAKSHFLANMSHEIRTPLCGILGVLDIVASRLQDAKLKDYLRQAKEAGEGLTWLLTDMLAIADMDSGRCDRQEKCFAPGEVCASVVQSLASSARSKNIALHCFLDSRLPETVVGDAPRTRHVLFNLVSNAVKFTHQGEVAVRVQMAEGGRRKAEGNAGMLGLEDAGTRERGDAGEMMLEAWDVYPVEPGSPPGCLPGEIDKVTAQRISPGSTAAGIDEAGRGKGEEKRLTVRPSDGLPVPPSHCPTVLLLFTIRDTGIGIPQDRISDIFEPFIQVDDSLARQYQGAGLGLTVVKRLVDQLGGNISVESTEGKGTAVHVVLPFALPDTSAMNEK